MNHSEKAIRKFKLDSSRKGTRAEKFKLKVSENKKYELDGTWFEEIMEHYVPSDLAVVDDYDKMKAAYELINNNHESLKTHLDKFCNSLGENLDLVEEDVLPFPVLHNKVNIHKGEMLKRNDHHKVILLTAKAIKDRDEQLLKAISDSVEEKVSLIIEEQYQKMQGMKPEEVEQYIDQLRTQEAPADVARKKFQSEFEIFYNKALKFAYVDQSILRKKMETVEDAVVSNKFAIYSGWEFGKPTLNLRNPLYLGWHKSPNQTYIHKGDYVWYKSPITITEAIEKYNLSDAEVEEIHAEAYGNQKVDSRHGLGPHKKQFVRDQTDQHLAIAADSKGANKQVGLAQDTGVSSRYYADQLVWETHFEFKAYRKITFLSYLDDYNKKIITPLPEMFKIPSTAMKKKFVNKFGNNATKHIWTSDITGIEYTAEVIYIPRRYEVTRLSNSFYTRKREVPNQPFNIDNPFSTFTLSTFGCTISARNAESISPVMRAIPSYLQFVYIKHLQNRELKKYQGYIQNVDVDQIPLALGQDIEGNMIKDPIAVWKLYRKQEGVNFYSGSQNASGGPAPATRSPGSTGHIIGTASEIFQLEQLANLIKVEIGMAMGISPQREAQFSQYSNVSDNQQAIAQSYHITEPLYFYVNEVWKDALNDYLYNFRTFAEQVYARDEEEISSLHFFLPDGTEELLQITPKVLQHINIGLFVSNSGNEQQYNQMMLQLSQSISQNAGEGAETVSELVKAITQGTSPEETHKLLMVASDKQQKRMEDMQKMQAEQAQQLEQARAKAVAEEHERGLEVIDRKGEWDIRVAEIRAAQNFENPDLNNNQVPDVLEVEKLKQKALNDTKEYDVKNRALDLQDKKLNQEAKAKAKDAELKKAEIKSKANKPK
jgi:hypothetical protein